MPSLPNNVLFAKLRAALPPETRFETAIGAVHPAVAVVPGVGRVRFYLWTVTPDRSAEGARPPGEFKIQLIVEGQVRPARGALELGDGAQTVLLGLSPDYGVFVGWEARLYQAFAFSRNVQVREALLAEASATGWAVDEPRQLRSGEAEVRTGFSPGNMRHYLRVSRSADTRNLKGSWREAYFLSHALNETAERLPTRNSAVEAYVERERRRLASTRFSRDARFAPLIKDQFGHACAVCRVQLEIVEAAHIIPAREAGSRDEVWNGLALCPNHHRLHDAHLFIVRPDDLRLQLNIAALAFLHESNRAAGVEVLTDFDGEPIVAPRFWGASTSLQNRMREALTRNAAVSAVT